MLGSRAEAEDMVQEAYLRWHRAARRNPHAGGVAGHRDHATVHRPPARVAQPSARPMSGRGCPSRWPRTAPPADQATELASDLSVAFLALLERLAPEERAAFLLHEVFDSDYDDIAPILGKSETTCRQIVSRARKRVRDGRPRVQVSADRAQRGCWRQLVHAIQAHDK